MHRISIIEEDARGGAIHGVHFHDAARGAPTTSSPLVRILRFDSSAGGREGLGLAGVWYEKQTCP